MAKNVVLTFPFGVKLTMSTLYVTDGKLSTYDIYNFLGVGPLQVLRCKQKFLMGESWLCFPNISQDLPPLEHCHEYYRLKLWSPRMGYFLCNLDTGTAETHMSLEL